MGEGIIIKSPEEIAVIHQAGRVAATTPGFLETDIFSHRLARRWLSATEEAADGVLECFWIIPRDAMPGVLNINHCLGYLTRQHIAFHTVDK